MVSLFTYRNYTGFDIDALLRPKQKGATVNKNADKEDLSGFDAKVMESGHSGRLHCENAIIPNVSHVTYANHVHSSKDLNFCASCFDTGNTHENLLNSMRPYEISTHNISSHDLLRSGGMSTNPLPVIEQVSRVSPIQNTDIRPAALGNLGLKLHNSFVHLDNFSNLSNMSNIPPSYSSLANLYSPTGHLTRVSSPPHIDRTFAGPSFSWAQTRGAGLFTARCHDTALFMSPYRKPKRIRTAFSPTQLLRLEHAFEKNHYVVGQERKDLASTLNLSETQVKVWFQNRRTKHKRMRAEEDMTSSISRRLNNTGDSNESSTYSDLIIDS